MTSVVPQPAHAADWNDHSELVIYFGVRTRL